MSEGLQAWNNNGTIVIDDAYANLCLRAQGTAGYSWTSIQAEICYSDVTYANDGTPPLIFVNYPQPSGRTDCGLGLIATFRDGNSWTFRFMHFYGENTTVPDRYFTYYVYDAPYETYGEGIKVWSEGHANLMFNSELKPLIVQSYTGSGMPTGAYAYFAFGSISSTEDVDAAGHRTGSTRVNGLYSTSTGTGAASADFDYYFTPDSRYYSNVNCSTMIASV